MKLPALLLVLCLSSARGLIDCRTACRSCRTAKEPPELLSILCAMCQECKERRRERLAANQNPAVATKAPTPPRHPAPLETRQPATSRESPRYNTEGLRYITKPRKYNSEAPRYIPAEPDSYEQNTALRQNEAPQGCPLSPVCPDDTVLETLAPCVVPPLPTTTTTTTTTTTLAPATCPPAGGCVKRNQPCCSSCYMPMVPCFMAPCPSMTAPPSTRRYIDVYVGIPTDANLRRNSILRKGEPLPVPKVFQTRLRQHNILNDRILK